MHQINFNKEFFKAKKNEVYNIFLINYKIEKANFYICQ